MHDGRLRAQEATRKHPAGAYTIQLAAVPDDRLFRREPSGDLCVGCHTEIGAPKHADTTRPTAKLIKQLLGRHRIGALETFSESLIHRSECGVSVGSAVLFFP